MLLRLQRDKKCAEIFGVEVSSAITEELSLHIDKVWNVNIENDFSPLQDYKGFFNFIILHDVVEHLYDPWFTLAKIRTLMSENGRILIATPNIHFWMLQYQILSGFFPYGPGLWHTGHLRWFTPISLIELLVIAGLRINRVCLEIPTVVDFSFLNTPESVKHIHIPPENLQGTEQFENTYTLSYRRDIKQYYPVFYAHKVIADCGKGGILVEPGPMTYNCPNLEAVRKALQLPFDIFNPPPMEMLFGT